jgi:acyl homoserine lactone synthase
MFFYERKNMIVSINQKTLPLHGELYISQFRLRHDAFIKRQNYDVKQFDGMEFDQYDTPAAAYLVYTKNGVTALGCSRLTPITVSSMVMDLWPDLFHWPDITEDPTVWEATRFCVRKELPPAVRRMISRELVHSYFDYGLANGVTKIIGVMQPRIIRSVFGDLGCKYDLMGPRKRLATGETIVAASMEISLRSYNALLREQKNEQVLAS